MAKKKFKWDKKHVQEAIDEYWPLAKKELEKGIVEAKKMIDVGEKYLADVTDKGVRNVKVMSLKAKKETLIYELGKAVAKTPLVKCKDSRKINDILKEIKVIDRDVKKVGKKGKK